MKTRHYCLLLLLFTIFTGFASSATWWDSSLTLVKSDTFTGTEGTDINAAGNWLTYQESGGNVIIDGNFIYKLNKGLLNSGTVITVGSPNYIAFERIPHNTDVNKLWQWRIDWNNNNDRMQTLRIVNADKNENYKRNAGNDDQNEIVIQHYITGSDDGIFVKNVKVFPIGPQNGVQDVNIVTIRLWRDGDTNRYIYTVFYDTNFIYSSTSYFDFNVWKFAMTAGTNDIDSNLLVDDFNVATGYGGYLQNLTFDLNNSSIVSSDLNINFDLNASYSGFADAFWWQKDGNYIGSGSAGIHRQETTPGDFNYCITARTTSTDYNIQFCEIIKITQIMVKIPKDEQTLVLLSPFNIFLDSNSNNLYSGLTVDTNVFFATESETTNNLIIDYNTEYSQRNYSIQTSGSFQTIQPYLLKKSSSVYVIFYTKEKMTRETIPNALITIKKIINGTSQTISSMMTDSAGTATFNLIFNDPYYISYAYQAFSLSNQLIRPVQNAYDILINMSQIDGNNYYTFMSFDANYTPTPGSITEDAGYINLASSVFSNGKNIKTACINIDINGTVLYNACFNNSGNSFKTWNPAIPALDTSSITENSSLKIVWKITGIDDYNRTLTHSKSFFKTAGIDTLASMQELGEGIGQPGGSIIAIFAAILITGLAAGMIGSNPSLAIVFGMVLAIFSIIGFLPWGITALCGLAGFAYYYLRSGF